MYIDFFGKKILFIHIPKTGGTAIEEMFCRYTNNAMFVWPKYYENNIWGKNNGLEYQHLSAKQIFDEFKILNINDIDFIFTVVRNPYDRFASEVNWKDRLSKNTDKKHAIQNCFDDIETNPKYCHNLSQLNFLEGYIDKIKIYKYEDSFEQIIKDIKILCNLQIKIKIENINVTKNKVITKDDFGHEEKNKIISIYKDDFLFFNYNTN